FFEVSNQLYPGSDTMIMNIVDYFIETWNREPKEFSYSDKVYKKLKKLDSNVQPKSAAKRNTKPQDICKVSPKGHVKYNVRKLNELPRAILALSDLEKKLQLLEEHVYFHYEFIHGKAVLRGMDFLQKTAPVIKSIH